MLILLSNLVSGKSEDGKKLSHHAFYDLNFSIFGVDQESVVRYSDINTPLINTLILNKA